MKLFVDTNIIIDILLDRKTYGKDFEKVVRLAQDNRVQLVTSTACIATAYYISGRAKNVKNLRAQIAILLENFKSIGNISVQSAIDAFLSDFSDAEDALQYQVALFS